MAGKGLRPGGMHIHEQVAAQMNSKRESLILALICLVVVLLSLGGLVYGVISGLIFARDVPFTLDGILLALVCLMMGGIFSLMLLVLALKEGWVKLPGKKTQAEPATPAAKAPAEKAK